MTENTGRAINVPYGNNANVNASTPGTDSSDIDFLRDMRKKFEEAAEVWNEIFQEGKEDLDFLMGNQWDTEIKNQRKLEKRPCLTVNYLTRLVDIAIGDFRQNRIRINVRPADDAGDVKIAKIFEGIIRQIQNKSKAEVVYDTASEQSLKSSFGAFRITTKYIPKSFEQEIWIERIVNPHSVMFDPDARKQDFSDAKWCFVIDHMKKEEFERKYPGATTMDFSGTSSGQPYIGWFEKEKIRICEYWEVVEKEIELVELISGDVVEYDASIPDDFIVRDESGKQRRRKDTKRTVQQYIVSGADILEGPNEWLGKNIPIIPVLGRECWVDNKRNLTSLIRFAKDAQRMLNYWRTASTEHVALSPKAPILVTEAQIEGHEQEWRDMNVKPSPYMIYVGNTGDPLPQRIAPPQVPSGILQEASNCVGDIQTITNMHEAVTGQPSNERSGKAISARQRQSNISTFTFFDNLQNAIQYAGEILVDIIPKIYSEEKILKMVEDDGTEEVVAINQKQIDPLTGTEKILNDLSTGNYEVVTVAGPSFITARIEAAENMLQFMQTIPQSAQFIADLFAKNLDFPGADEIAARLRKLLPPGLAKPMPGDPPPQPPQPNPQQVMDQQKMQMQGMQTQQEFAIKQKEMELSEKKMIVEMQKLGVELERVKTEMHKTMTDRQKSHLSSKENMRKVVIDILKELHEPVG